MAEESGTRTTAYWRSDGRRTRKELFFYNSRSKQFIVCRVLYTSMEVSWWVVACLQCDFRGEAHTRDLAVEFARRHESETDHDTVVEPRDV